MGPNLGTGPRLGMGPRLGTRLEGRGGRRERGRRKRESRAKISKAREERRKGEIVSMIMEEGRGRRREERCQTKKRKGERME